MIYRRITVEIDITELNGHNEHRVNVQDRISGSDVEVRDKMRWLMTQATDSLRVHDAEVVDEPSGLDEFHPDTTHNPGGTK